MGIIQRQSIKGTLVFIIGAAIHFSTMLLMIPKMLGEADQAVYRVVFSLILMFSVFGVGGANAALLKHLPDFENKPKERKVFNFVTLVYTIIVALITLALVYCSKNIIYVWKGNSNAYLLNYFWCIPIGSFFATLLYYFEYYSIATHRLTAPSIVREIILKIILMASVLLYHFQYISIHTFFMLFALSYALGCAIMMVYCVLIRDFKIGFDKAIFKTIPFKEYIPYTFFIFILGILASLILNSDQPIVYGMLGAHATDIYGLAVTTASMITIPYKPLSAILLPFMYDAWGRNDTKKLNEINQESAKNLTAIGVLLYLLLVCNVHHLFQFVKPELAFFKMPLIIIGIGRVLDYTTGASTEMLISAPSHKRMVLFMSLTFLFSLGCYYFLIPIYKEVGAAIACTATLIFFNVLKYTHLKKRYNLQPFTKQTFYFLLLGTIIFLVQYYLPTVNNFIVDIIFRSGVITLLYCGIIYYFGWMPMVNNFIGKKFNKEI